MTDTAPSVQPVRAWAVVDRDGISVEMLFRDEQIEKECADDCAASLNLSHPEYAPHRVIRVEIREVNDE